MTLADLAAALRRFRLLAIGLFVVIFAAGAAAALLPAETFRSSAVIQVVPTTADVGFETQQAIQLTIPPTIARLEAANFEQGVRRDVAPDLRTVAFAIAGVHDPGTSIVDVSVTSETPVAAVNVARSALLRLAREPRSDRFKIDVVSPPEPATSVKAARIPPIVVGSLVLSLIVSLLTAAALHRLLPTLPRADSFRERYGHEILGEIPRTRRRERRRGAQAAVGADASGELIEAFRSLEARVALRTAAHRERDRSISIAVTSWAKLEGKSTVVANLAYSLAASGREVTVVDCDMRRPRIHELMDCELSPGVADVSDGIAVASLRQATRLASLDVIAAGQLARHPAEVAQEAVPLLLSLLSERVVLVDAPPLFTAETTTIVGDADFVILVADFGRRRPQDIDAALDELEPIGTPLLGVVLNRVDIVDARGRAAYVYRPIAARSDQQQPPLGKRSSTESDAGAPERPARAAVSPNPPESSSPRWSTTPPRAGGRSRRRG